jgi:hypothetical protein
MNRVNSGIDLFVAPMIEIFGRPPVRENNGDTVKRREEWRWN